MASLGAGAGLDALDDEGHFLFGEGLVAVLAAIADGRGATFDELTRDTDDGETAGDAGGGFGLGEGLFADAHDPRNVGDGAGVDIGGGLVGTANADDFEVAGVGLFGDHGFNKFGADVKGEQGAIGWDRLRLWKWLRSGSHRLEGLFGLGGGGSFDFSK